MNETTRSSGVLFVDIEGGWGGSSRSLFYLIKYLDKERFNPVVLLGRPGPMKALYKAEGVETSLFNPIPRTTAMERNNLRALGRFVLQLHYLPRILSVLGKLIRKHHVVLIHLNHESLYFLGLFCRVLFPCKIVYHVRTMLPFNLWAKIQILICRMTAHHLIFITENERDLWIRMVPKVSYLPHDVIHNIGEPSPGGMSQRLKDQRGKFKIISLMTISHRRGTDRLVEVAQCLKEKKRDDVLFVVCGKPDEKEYGDWINERIRQAGLEDFFLFLGHQSSPESILAECDLLLRPSREYNPWGRDVIEALVMGKPVMAIGHYNKFIEDGVNGYLLTEFDPLKIAEKIVFLKEHPQEIEEMRQSNVKKADRLFNGAKNARRVAHIYDALLAGTAI